MPEFTHELDEDHMVVVTKPHKAAALIKEMRAKLERYEEVIYRHSFSIVRDVPEFKELIAQGEAGFSETEGDRNVT